MEIITLIIGLAVRIKPGKYLPAEMVDYL